MQYLGGKSRIAKPISEIILAARGERHFYVEPFLGAGSVALRVAPLFPRAVLTDLSPDLVKLWKAVQRGWTPPTTLTEDEYRALRHAKPSALRGFAGFPCSFGGKWFGGYARDPKGGRNFAESASRSMVARGKALSDALILRADYRDVLASVPLHDAVIYADPPYAGTTAYGNVESFDSAEFWREMKRCAAAGARVFVSEYIAPKGWHSVWSADPISTLRRDNIESSGEIRRASEHLFTRDERMSMHRGQHLQGCVSCHAYLESNGVTVA